MEDPIAAEIHRHREAFAKKFNYNVRAMLEDVRQREPASGHRVVSFAARRKPRVPAKPR